MDKPYIVDFGEGEERWQDPELGKKWSGWIETEKKGDAERKKQTPTYQGLSDGYYRDRASKEYKTELIQKYLNEHPDTSIFEPEDDESVATDDILIRSHFGLSPKDLITPQHKNYAIAWRMARGLADENEPFLANLDKLYNRQTIEEDKTWEAAKSKTPIEKPVVIQSTSPSRLQSLGVFGQQIDPNVPIFLQKANPHIPWGVNHPLKKLYRKHALTRRATENREEYEYDAMEKLNNPRYLEEDMYKDNDIDGEPWFHKADMAKEVKTFGYTPFLIDKMQTERQKSLLDLYEQIPPNDE
jgi:hypothetical protein